MAKSEANGDVPVAVVIVVIKAAGLFEDAGELGAARPHVVNVDASGYAARIVVFKRLASPRRSRL